MVLLGNSNYNRPRLSLTSLCLGTQAPWVRHRHATKYKSGDNVCTFETVLLTSTTKHYVIIGNTPTHLQLVVSVQIGKFFGPQHHHTTLNKLGFRMAGRVGNMITAFPGVTEKDGRERTNKQGR